MNPYQRALKEYLAGDAGAEIVVERSDGYRKVARVADYFRQSHLPPVEAAAIERCGPTVLDAGAGTGRHSLLLSRLGHKVTSIDIAPTNVGVMRRMGVPEPVFGDVLAAPLGQFDTILMLNRGIGMCGRLSQLPEMLRSLRTRLLPGGTIVADSTDEPRGTLVSGCDVELRLGYRDAWTGWFRWAYIDAESLAECAAAEGWGLEVLARDGYDFSFILHPSEGCRG